MFINAYSKALSRFENHIFLKLIFIGMLLRFCNGKSAKNVDDSRALQPFGSFDKLDNFKKYLAGFHEAFKSFLKMMNSLVVQLFKSWRDMDKKVSKWMKAIEFIGWTEVQEPNEFKGQYRKAHTCQLCELKDALDSLQELAEFMVNTTQDWNGTKYITDVFVQIRNTSDEVLTILPKARESFFDSKRIIANGLDKMIRTYKDELKSMMTITDVHYKSWTKKVKDNQVGYQGLRNATLGWFLADYFGCEGKFKWFH